MGYRIWFERRVTPELMPFVPPSVDMLGPGRDNDPSAGISTAQAAIAARLVYDVTLFDRATDLLGVFRTGIGYDTVDLEAATRRGIAACDPYLPDEAFPPGVERARTLEELLGRSDAVSVHIPMSAGNYRMFNAGTFAAMKKGALFVNAARGGLVDHDALTSALDSGHLSGAGLDVTDPEPLHPDHPLLHRADVIVTPHVASATPEARERMFRMAVRQALMVLDGQRPPHLVNPDAWPGVLDRLAGAR